MPRQILQMVNEIKKCESVGAWNACLLQIYAYIDALAFLGLPADKTRNTRSDYIAWVDKYLVAHQNQIYKYRGRDVYGARCAILHKFSSSAEFHDTNEDTLVFGYHDGGMHCYDRTINASLVMIGIPSLTDDFIRGVCLFLEDIKVRISDSAERQLMQNRLDQIIGTVPFNAESR
jgi:hypothetical protein